MTKQLPPLVTARWNAERSKIELTICDDEGTSATLYLALATLPKLRDGVERVIHEANRVIAEQTGRVYQQPPPGRRN